MKSILGLTLATVVVLAFALADKLATSDHASLLDQQWLFLVALPYNFAMLQLFGETNFSADAPVLVAAAAVCEAAVAYIAGAVVEAALRGIWRGFRRFRSPA